MSTVGDLENANYAARALPTHKHTHTYTQHQAGATVAKGKWKSSVVASACVCVCVSSCVSPMAKRVSLQSRSRIRI